MVLAVAVALAVLTVAVLVPACSTIGRPRDLPSTDRAASEQTYLSPATARQEVGAGALCASVDPADLVECEVLDLFPSVRRNCPEGQTVDQSPPCALPGTIAGQRLAWTLTVEPGRGRLRTLTIFSGAEILSATVRGSDASPPWLTASVCPADVTGDGLIDVVAMFRSVTAPNELIIEVVNVAETPSRVLTLPAQPFDPDRPQGCRSEYLARLRFDQATRALQLAPEEELPGDRPLIA